MNITELSHEELSTIDIESCAIIFSSRTAEYNNLWDFGDECIKQKDVDGEPLISPWKDADYPVRELTGDGFWNSCNITEYLEANTVIRRGRITKAICFWEEWNSKFHALELDNGQFYGISWWTTA